MALDPGDIDALVRAIASVTLPAAAATLLIGMTYSLIVGLKLVAPKAKKLIMKEINDPEGPLAAARENERRIFLEDARKMVREEIAALPKPPALPDYAGQLRAMHGQLNARITNELKPLKEKIEGLKMPEIPEFALPENIQQLPAAYNGLAKTVVESVGVLNELSKRVTDEHLLNLMKKAISDMHAAGKARGDGGGGSVTALEDAANDIVWAAENPEQAEALAVAHESINALAPVFNWNEKKIKQLHEQANSIPKRGGNLKAFTDRLAKLAEGHGVGAPRATLTTKGGRQPGEP